MTIKIVSLCRNTDKKAELALMAFNFSAGEEQVRLIGETPDSWNAKIYAEVKNSSEFMRLLLVCNACVEKGAVAIKLVLPYLPYSRQDRVCYDGEANSLETVLKLFKTVGVAAITTWDMHNPTVKSPFLLINIMAHFWVDKIRESTDWIVAPDTGAIKRASDCCPNLSMLVKCDKERDPDTGYLSKVIIIKSVGSGNFPACANLLIVDDICDGGRTFINLAKELRKHTSGKIKLFVTHGIFSQGLEPLLEHIDHIYTANCMWNPSFLDNPKLTLVKLNEH